MRLLFAALALLTMTPAAAAGLPGGASALSETHGDWTVRCEVAGEALTCALQQRQTDRQSGQQILALDLRPAEAGLTGLVVLPFGLSLVQGIGLAVDELAPLSRLPFRTCLPQGCLVDLDLGPEVLAQLRGGTTLHIESIADGGSNAPFSVSLNGFASALDRAAQLLGQ